MSETHQVAAESCFHCGLPIPVGAVYRVAIDGVERQMCCAGCQAVAQAIVANDLTDFYRFRTDVGNRPEDLIPDQLRDLQVYDSEELQRSFVRVDDEHIREASLILEGIVCAACVWLNERHVRQLEGVLDFRVNYSTHRATLRWDNSRLRLSDVLKAITEIGYHAHPFDPSKLQNLQKKEKSAALRRIAVAGLGMMQVMMVAIALYIGEASDMDRHMRGFLRWISFIMTTPVVFYSARVFFSSAWRDLRRSQFGMDVPVSLAIGIAYLASVWATWTGAGEVYFDSVTMFTFFLLTGRYLEMVARHKSGQIAEELVRLTPATAIRVTETGQETVAVSALVLGDHVLIKPGDSVPVDGVVIEGTSSINESLLTGESLPRHKQVGDNLVGGTLNIESPLLMRVDKLGDHTVLAAITRLLERAQTEKPHLAQVADKVASWFVLFILILSATVFVFWYFREPEHAFWIMLSVLVVTCPCALSLATPVALTAATSVLTSYGVLTTRGHALDALAKVKRFIFDKTGTLTDGELHVLKVHVLGSLDRDSCQCIAAGLECASEHPVAKAITTLCATSAAVSHLQTESGRGVRGTIEGQEFRLGTPEFVGALVNQPMVSVSLDIEDEGLSRVYLGSEQQWLAVFLLADQIREEAPRAVQALHELKIQLSLLSGDTPNVVQRLAQTLGIETAKGACLPADKLQVVQAYQQSGEVVAMVGDGVNDAPVLAAAQVSVAMGSGSQLAQASADMVLLSENLQRLPLAVRIARKTQRIIYQNFAWAIVYNVLAIPLAASGILPPWVAALGMSASSLIVVLNAMRLRVRDNE